MLLSDADLLFLPVSETQIKQLTQQNMMVSDQALFHETGFK